MIDRDSRSALVGRRGGRRWRDGRRVVWLLVAALAACAATKPPSAFEEAFEDSAKNWQEIQSQLPAAPKESNLVVFGVSGATRYLFALDAASLSIGSDGVFRYTLVATSPEGVRNVSYEGIRCESAEHKLYATGRPDGTWVRSRNAAWLPIKDYGANRRDAALMKDYFCPDAYPAQSVDEVLGRLRVKRVPTNI